MEDAQKKGWVVTATTPKMPKKMASKDEETLKWTTIDGKGLKYGMTYAMFDARTIKLANDYTDLIVLMRNPSGKSTRGP